MKRIYTCFFIFTLLLFGFRAFSQTVVLQIDSVYLPTDTLTYGDSANISYSVRNISDSNLSYKGKIYTYLKTNLETTPLQIDSQDITIPNGGVEIINARFGVSSPYFEKDERSIVVVWPTGTGSVFFKPGRDSIKTSIQAAGNVSIQKTENSLNYVRFYPNPAQDILYFEIMKSGFQIKNIILHDLQGRIIDEIHVGEISGNAINFSNKKPGIYLMEITFSGHKKAFYKVIKSR